MEAVELVLKSAVIRVQRCGDSRASPHLAERAKHQSVEQRANAMREQWDENPLWQYRNQEVRNDHAY